MTTPEKARRLSYFVGALLAAPFLLLTIYASAMNPRLSDDLFLVPAVAYGCGWGLTRLWLWYKAEE